MVTEQIDRLFLELSQFTQAKTQRELELEREVRTLNERLAGELGAYRFSDRIATERMHNAESEAKRLKEENETLHSHFQDECGECSVVRERNALRDLDRLTDRFLTWTLPKDFAPDGGISFDGRKDDEWNKNKTWPVGTNLFTAEQAKAMIGHLFKE